MNPILVLDVATQANWHHAHHNLYVVELHPKIFEIEQRFLETNPHWLPGKLCVYVGMTGLTPEERFQKHLRGEKDAWFVHKYGQRLLPEVRPFRLRSPCGPCGDDTLRTSVKRSEVPRKRRRSVFGASRTVWETSTPNTPVSVTPGLGMRG
jgi:hypothetical protein